jgi:hypothetical protein
MDLQPLPFNLEALTFYDLLAGQIHFSAGGAEGHGGSGMPAGPRGAGIGCVTVARRLHTLESCAGGLREIYRRRGRYTSEFFHILPETDGLKPTEYNSAGFVGLATVQGDISHPWHPLILRPLK